MVAVFQNLDNGSFTRISNPTTNRDYDADQTNPTAIALLSLTASTTDPWDDIVVTNNDNDDPRDPSPYLGTVSVLQPAAVPTLTQPATTSFDDPVSVPSPSAINNLTVTLDLTDQQSVGNISVTLVAPNDDQLVLVENAIGASGTALHRQGLPGGNSIGVAQFTTGVPVVHGIDVGTIFDDNATRNIFDPTTTGTNGNTATDYIGYFRPEGGSLANFIASLGGDIDGTWKLVITNYAASTATAPAVR